MIDLASETLISFSDACRRLPSRRAGRPAHPATLYRWASEGVRGVRLETIRVGGSLCTSVEALQRFCEQLTRSDDRSVVSPAEETRKP
jgi:uncharacterized protein DUF1580